MKNGELGKKTVALTVYHRLLVVIIDTTSIQIRQHLNL